MIKVEIMKQIGKWVIALLIPFFILITVARLLLTPAYLQIEYRMPGFPEDGYGFSMEDRLNYASFALEYLLNSEGIDYLAELEFKDGSELFNEHELSHMLDVKDLVQVGKRVWTGIFLMLLIVGVVAWRWDMLVWYRSAFSLGGLVSVSFLALISFIGLLSFDALFTNFHRIFFEDGTWLFYYSDTLIRLFPIRFWQDVVIAEILLSIATGFGLWLGLRKKDSSNE